MTRQEFPMGNHTNEVEDAAPGGSGAHEPGCGCGECTAVTGAEALSELNGMADRLAGQGKGAAAEALKLVAEGTNAAVKAGVSPLLIAEALAGGDEVAAGRMYDLRAGEDHPEGGTYDNVMDEVLRTVRPKVRNVAIWSAVSRLTDDDLVSLVRSWAARSPEKLAERGLVVADLNAGIDPGELTSALEATELDMDKAASLVRRLGNHRKRELAERGLVVFGNVSNATRATSASPA
jgi:hypothetical protein